MNVHESKGVPRFAEPTRSEKRRYVGDAVHSRQRGGTPCWQTV